MMMGDPLEQVRFCGWPGHKKPRQAFSTFVIRNYDVSGEEYHYHICSDHEKTINQIINHSRRLECW